MIKFILICFFLIPSFSVATGLTFSKRYDEKKTNRFGLAVGIAAHNVSDKSKLLPKDVYGFGLQQLSAKMFNSKQLIPGFEILSSISMGAASYGKLFSNSSLNNELSGFLLDSELGLRYLYQVNDKFDVGGQFLAGYGFIFAYKLMEEAIGTMGPGWPAHFQVGPAGRMNFDENLNLYFSMLYTLRGIGSSSKSLLYRDNIIGGLNKHGLELPIGVSWVFNNNISVFTETNIALRDLSAHNLGFLAGLNIGFIIDYKR